MLDPEHTTDEHIQTLCDETKIAGLTWEIQDDDLLFVYKDPTAFVLEDDEEEEEEEEDWKEGDE